MAGSQTDSRLLVAKAPDVKPSPSRLQGVIYAPNTAAPFDLVSALMGPKREEPSWAPAPEPASVERGRAARQAFTHRSEYQATYRAWPTPPAYQRTYAAYDPPTGDLDFLTSYTRDYRRWSVQTRPPIRQREEFDRPTGPFQHMTTYQADFPPKMAIPARTRRTQRRFFS